MKTNKKNENHVISKYNNKILKILEFQARIWKIIKIVDFQERLMKILKIIEFHVQNHETHVNLQILYENQENNENQRNLMRIIKS